MKYMKELRQKMGLTQAELAERVGIGMNTIARYERGEMAPSIQIAHAIAEALHVTEAELLNGPERQEFEVKILMGVKDLGNMPGLEVKDNCFLYGVQDDKPQIHLAGKVLIGTPEERKAALELLIQKFYEACWMFDHKGECPAAAGA